MKGYLGCKKPLSMICNDLATIDQYCYGIDRQTFKILKSAFPGPFTIILPASSQLPKMMFLDSKGGKHSWARKSLGVRMPDDPVLRYVQEELGGTPLLVSSVPNESFDGLGEEEEEEDGEGDGIIGVAQLQSCRIDFGSSWCQQVDFVVDGGERPDPNPNFAEIGRDVIDGRAKPYIVPCKDVRLDDGPSKALWEDLHNQGCAITGLTSFGGYEDVPLRYGEIIPISFLRHSLNKEERNQDGSKKKDPSCIIISLPNRRYEHGSEMVGEMVEFGSKLYESLGRIFAKKRVGVLVSADLAHTHAEDGPYGFSPAADPFDTACGEWAKHLDEKALLHDARELLDDAKSCGYLGLAILHGLLNQERDSWECQVREISHPTYYGMMVSSFIRR